MSVCLSGHKEKKKKEKDYKKKKGQLSPWTLDRLGKR
jgi:hypothetical protein